MTVVFTLRASWMGYSSTVEDYLFHTLMATGFENRDDLPQTGNRHIHETLTYSILIFVCFSEV